jgi:phasin family protein
MANKPEEPSVMSMFENLGKELRLPSVDVDQVLEHHRKNLEALQRSASASATGTTTLLNKQREILEEQMRAFMEMAQGFGGGGNPREAMEKQAALARRVFESAVKNTSEMASIVQKSGAESLDILRERIRQSMDEIRQGSGRAK